MLEWQFSLPLLAWSPNTMVRRRGGDHKQCRNHSDHSWEKNSLELLFSWAARKARAWVRKSSQSGRRQARMWPKHQGSLQGSKGWLTQTQLSPVEGCGAGARWLQSPAQHNWAGIHPFASCAQKQGKSCSGRDTGQFFHNSFCGKISKKQDGDLQIFKTAFISHLKKSYLTALGIGVLSFKYKRLQLLFL